MLLDLGALWLVVWLIKNATMDVACAVKGQANPRYELKKAQARAAGKPDPAQPRYGSKDWFADLVSDGLQAQTEARRRRAAEKRQAREEAEAAKSKAIVTTPAPVEQPAPTPTSDPADGGAAGPEQTPTTPQPPAAPEVPTAQIIQFPTSKENGMTTAVNGEVIGLDQSIAYAKSLGKFAGDHAAAGNEGYIGHLAASKVQGAGLQTAHDMQEAFAIAAGAAEKHAAELEKQKSVQEAYATTPDAGDKAFQTEGR